MTTCFHKPTIKKDIAILSPSKWIHKLLILSILLLEVSSPLVSSLLLQEL